MFRNARFFRLDGDWPDSEDAVSEKLQRSAFEPCGPLTERRSGWVPIDAESSDSLARRVNGADLIKLRSQSRVLPAAAIREELEKRIEEYQERMQEKPGAREMRRLKAETRDELLPKAMLKSDRIHGYVAPRYRCGTECRGGEVLAASAHTLRRDHDHSHAVRAARR
jgi:recombination associated protein RdgC